MIARGLPGLARGLYVLDRLIGKYWHCLHPDLENGDPTWRLNILAALSDPSGLLSELQRTVVASKGPNERLTVRDVITFNESGIGAQAERERDRAYIILASDPYTMKSAGDVVMRFAELRLRLLEEIGDEAEAPLRGLGRIVCMPNSKVVSILPVL